MCTRKAVVPAACTGKQLIYTKTQKVIMLSLSILVVLNSIDAVATSYAIYHAKRSTDGGLFVEGNPLMAELVYGSPLSFILVKAVIVPIAFTTTTLVLIKRNLLPRFLLIGLSFLNGYYFHVFTDILPKLA